MSSKTCTVFLESWKDQVKRNLNVVIVIDPIDIKQRGYPESRKNTKFSMAYQGF